MGLKVVHDGETWAGAPIERCCICRAPTRFWHRSDVALCPGCAQKTRRSELPLKVEWCSWERNLNRRITDFANPPIFLRVLSAADSYCKRAGGDDVIELEFNVPYGFVYTNWRGIVAPRRAVFRGMRFGVTEYHDVPQWLLDGFDLDKRADRLFALRDIDASTIAPTTAVGISGLQSSK